MLSPLQRAWRPVLLALLTIVAVLMFVGSAIGSDASRSGRASHVCRTSQMTIRMVHTMAGLGHAGGTIAYTNDSSSTCQLHGWPQLIAITTAGRLQRAKDVAGNRVGTGLRGTPTLILRPRGQAYAVFEGPDGSPTGGSCLAPFRVLKITPPGNSTSVSLSAYLPALDAYLPACGRILVSPMMFASSLGPVLR